MNLGNLRINVLKDGTIKFDGGGMFGVVPKVLWERKIRCDRKNRVSMGLNCLLIRSNSKNILVDTGVGRKEPEKIKEHYGLSVGKLLRGLKDYGLTARDINIVLLSHLHFDHCGGATKLDSKGRVVPTFPKATYFAQKLSWEDATDPDTKGASGYHPDDFMPIFERGRLELLDGDAEIIPGVSVKLTNGHARGHQITIIGSGRQKVVYLGELIPSHYHLNPQYISAFDQFPMETLKLKRELIQQAEKEGWLVIFGHDPVEAAGYVERRNGQVHFKPVTI